MQNILDNQNRIEESLTARMAEFEKIFKASSSSDSKLSLDKLTQDYKIFKDNVWSILQLLRSQVQSVASQTDDLETYNRRNALLFSGIEEKDSENCKDLVINIIQTTMGLTGVQASCMYSCHRLGTKSPSRTRPILARFTDATIRNMIWMEKRRLKSSPTVIGEFLTKPRQSVFGIARRHFGINRCWTRDGAVFIKLPNNERRRITTAEELEHLTSKFPSTHIKTSTVSGDRAKTGPAEVPVVTPEPPLVRKAAVGAKTRSAK